MPKPKTRVDRVYLGHRKFSRFDSNEKEERRLENGRNLRKTEAPIECKFRIMHSYEMSEEKIEKINRNLMKRRTGFNFRRWRGRYACWTTYGAIIPVDAISKGGYVKEAWVLGCSKRVKIGNQSYEVIEPYIHDPKQAIQGFVLDPDPDSDDIALLPSAEIIIKYLRKIKTVKVDIIENL